MTIKEMFKKNWKEIVFAKILVITEAIALFTCGLFFASNVIVFSVAAFVSALAVFAVISNFIALIAREKVLFIDELELSKEYKCLSKTVTKDLESIYVLEQTDNEQIIVVKAPNAFIPTNQLVRVSMNKTRLEPSVFADPP